MTHQKTIVHMALLGTAVLAPLLCHIEISSGQSTYSAASTLVKLFSDQDIYSATALLRVEPPQTTKHARALTCDMMNRQVRNYTETILCEIVLDKACESVNLGDGSSDRLKELSGKDTDPVAFLKREVHIRQLPGTDFIAISLTGKDPIFITEIVNAIAEAAVEDAKKEAGEKCSEQIHIIQFESKIPKARNDDKTKQLEILDERVRSLVPWKVLLMEQRVLLQTKVSTQLKLIAARTRLKNCSEGNNNTSLRKKLTEDIQTYEEQLAWCKQETQKNSELLQAHYLLRQQRKSVKKELDMLEREIQSLDKKIMHLRMRMRGEQPLQLYRRAILPAEPSTKENKLKDKSKA